MNNKKYTEVYYGTTEKDAQTYADKHAKPYGFECRITKNGTKTRPYVLSVLMNHFTSNKTKRMSEP